MGPPPALPLLHRLLVPLCLLACECGQPATEPSRGSDSSTGADGAGDDSRAKLPDAGAVTCDAPAELDASADARCPLRPEAGDRTLHCEWWRACNACVASRCSACAQACDRDTACADMALSAQYCLSECVGPSCKMQCLGSDPQLNALYECRTAKCALPCVSGPAVGQTCSAHGATCDPLDPGFACCEDAGRCVWDAGAPWGSCR